MYILNGVCNYKSSGSLTKAGYLKYEDGVLEFWKYKGFPGRYDLIIYILIKIVTLFMKDKLIFAIKKDDIQSLKIEEGQNIGGISGRLMSITGSNKMPDTFIVTTKDGTEYRFMISDESRKEEDHSTFNDLVLSMGMFLS